MENHFTVRETTISTTIYNYTISFQVQNENCQTKKFLSFKSQTKNHSLYIFFDRFFDRFFFLLDISGMITWLSQTVFVRGVGTIF